MKSSEYVSVYDSESTMFCPNHGLAVFLTDEVAEVQLKESLLFQGPKPKVINTPCVAILSIQGTCVCRSYLILTTTS